MVEPVGRMKLLGTFAVVEGWLVAELDEKHAVLLFDSLKILTAAELSYWRSGQSLCELQHFVFVTIANKLHSSLGVNVHDGRKAAHPEVLRHRSVFGAIDLADHQVRDADLLDQIAKLIVGLFWWKSN